MLSQWFRIKTSWLAVLHCSSDSSQTVKLTGQPKNKLLSKSVLRCLVLSSPPRVQLLAFLRAQAVAIMALALKASSSSRCSIVSLPECSFSLSACPAAADWL